MLRTLAFVSTMLAATGAVAAPLEIGDTFLLQSEALGEARRINVYTPAAYGADTERRFPVLYMPDGGIEEDFLHLAGLVQISSLNGAMQPVLLVGIENTERRRDLTGPTASARDREIAPRVGGSAAFRRFLAEELRPRIDTDYRTDGTTAIVGESLAGLFVVETLLVQPDLFDAYVAVDPSLWWDERRLVTTGRERLLAAPDLDASLYVATCTPGNRESSRRFATTTAADLPGLRVAYAEFPRDTHATIFHPAALEGLRWVFPGPSLKEDPAAEAEVELRDAVTRFGRAFREARVATLDSLLTDDYVHVDGGSASVLDRTSWLEWVGSRRARIVSGELRYDGYRVGDLRIHLHGEAAVVTGVVHARGRDGEEPFASVVRVTNLWVRQEGLWRRAAFHDTPLR